MRFLSVQSVKTLLVSMVVTTLSAAPTNAGGLGKAEYGPEVARQYQAAVAKAVTFLEKSQQEEDGSWSSFAGVGPTALVTTALLRHGRASADPVVKKGLEYVLAHQQVDGGIYVEGSSHRNYETCVAVVCLAEANTNGRYDNTIKKADAFLKGIQWDEGEGKTRQDPEYGGAGYGSQKRPDLSNTSFFIDALRAAGNDEDDEALQRALLFVSRCQNLDSEFNDQPQAGKVNDGGFFYTVAAGGESKAGESADGGLRSYGSMTYAGLKSLIYAGVEKNDQRVKAAKTWIGKHYTLEDNPGMDAQGLYYYYHTFGKCLGALDAPTFVDENGKAHDWRAELIQELAQRQREDGSWTNETTRWLEGDPNLVTAYCLLALGYCHPDGPTSRLEGGGVPGTAVNVESGS